MSKNEAQKIAEAIGNHVAAEYEDDPALDRMILQLRTAAKSEPVTIDREALTSEILDHSIDRANCACGEQLPDMTPETISGHYADAVIAHIAAQSVTGAVEWEFFNNDRGWVRDRSEGAARKNALYFGHQRVRSRTVAVSEWVEVPDA